MRPEVCMCDSHATPRGSTGSVLTSACQTLSAGNAVHEVPGSRAAVPATRVAADARSGVDTAPLAAHATAVSTAATVVTTERGRLTPTLSGTWMPRWCA